MLFQSFITIFQQKYALKMDSFAFFGPIWEFYTKNSPRNSSPRISGLPFGKGESEEEGC